MKHGLINRLNFKIKKLSKDKFIEKEKNLIIIARKEKSLKIKNKFYNPTVKLVEKNYNLYKGYKILKIINNNNKSILINSKSKDII